MGYRTTKFKAKAGSNRTNNYTEFFYHAFRNILLVSIPLVIIFALILSIPHSSATVSGASADSLTLSLPTSCTLSSVVNSAHNATLISGTYTSDIGKTTITTLCNDGNGYAIYANGLSNGTVGNNALISSVSSNHNIATGIYHQGDTTSSWAMKLGNISGDTSPTPPVIEQGYNNTYGLVPSTWTKVAGRTSGTTDMITGSTFTTTYAVYTAPTQHAGTYTGQVAYALIHGSGDNVGTLHFMQNVSEWQNEIPNPGDTLQAMDTRDGKQYWVTRLADGHIWMTQNLDLDLSYVDAQGNTIIRNFTSEDTDLTDHSKTGAYADGYEYDETTGITTWTPIITAKTINFEGTTVVGWQSSREEPRSASKTDSTATGHASLGNYYNWAAAIASNDVSPLTQETYRDITNNPQNSICPKGWRLPTISNQSNSLVNSTNEFGRLNFLYNDNQTSGTGSGAKLIESPLWFARAGYVAENGSLNRYDSDGNYWSSTVQGPDYAYSLSFNDIDRIITNNVYGNDYRSRKVFGWSIRCVAR